MLKDVVPFGQEEKVAEVEWKLHEAQAKVLHHHQSQVLRPEPRRHLISKRIDFEKDHTSDLCRRRRWRRWRGS